MGAEYDIVMLALNDLSFDGRVRREATALAARGWRILVIGTQRANGALPEEDESLGFAIHRVRYGRFGRSLRRPWRWIRHGLQAVQIIRYLSRTRARVYHAHDLPALVLITAARWMQRQTTRLVYDSHELYLFQTPGTSRWSSVWARSVRSVFFAMERFVIRRADAVITVSESIARCLACWYAVPRPRVIRNCIDSMLPDDVCARAAPPYIVHTGDLTNRGRCLTELVDAFAHVPEGVDLVFLGEGEVRETLQTQVKTLGLTARVRFVPPVAPEAVPETIREARAAAVLLRSDSMHTRATLPNKLFEAVAAGLPVVATGGLALKRIVQKYHLGIWCDDAAPATIAGAVQAIVTPAAQAAYRECVRDAQHYLNWREESEKLRELYEDWLT